MLYKGLEIADAMQGVINHIHTVEEYRGNLQALQTSWDNLTLLGHLSGTGTDMSETRTAFHSLTGSLLNQLGQETLQKTLHSMRSKAQVAIDIMVRNLFERTADIGFLAMDGTIREFLKEAPSLDAEALGRRRYVLTQRFADYSRKYSVYYDIILLDASGNILASMEDRNGPGRSGDQLIQEALSTPSSYVETFRWSDLQPKADQSLIYSYRVTDESNDSRLGVLCLFFRFDDEAEKIFSNLIGKQDWSVVTLVDEHGKVIASSDAYHIPIGATIETALDTSWKVTRFAGREYLAVTRPTHGYQGYMGPGWHGHVMAPLEHAFDKHAHDNGIDIPPEVVLSVTRNKRLFSDTLRSIPLQAAAIQRDLNRSVWNGNVRQKSDQGATNPAFSKVLLWEISNTGLRTQDVFERSIANLNQTVVSSIQQDSGFQASLAIDIMDRNLYERANDCRWWAQSPVFREALAGKTSQNIERAQSTLVSINSLYTVYSNLILFDREGVVVAVSNPEFQSLVGQSIGEEWVHQTLSLKDNQQYTVSPFAQTPLYEGRHTYIYSASVRHPENESTIVGGVGIVFDSTPQFEAMLIDALPHDEQGKVNEGCFSLFLDRQRMVIASSNPAIAPGHHIDIGDHFFQLANRSSCSSIEVFQDKYFAIGARMSGGYREYKSDNDPYRNDLLAMVFIPLGERIEDRRNTRSKPARGQISHATRAGQEVIEIATFYVDDNWLGIATDYVVEAVSPSRLTVIPGSNDASYNYLMFRDKVIPVVGLWGALGESDQRHAQALPQVIVLRQPAGMDNGKYLGIMVDELGEIPEVISSRVEKIPQMLAGRNILAESVVKPEPGDKSDDLIVILSVENVFKKFIHGI